MLADSGISKQRAAGRDRGLRPWIWVAGVTGTLLGLLSLREGGSVLFVDGPERAAAGNYVPFVLWFNFLAGFACLAAGIGLLLQRAWAARLAMIIAVATLAVFVLFGLYIFSGGAYELRTVIAMTLRSAVWCLIAVLSRRLLLRDAVCRAPQ